MYKKVNNVNILNVLQKKNLSNFLMALQSSYLNAFKRNFLPSNFKNK